MNPPRRRDRRGFVLVAVLVVVACTVLVATGIVFLVRGEVAGTVNATDSMRLRAAAWSGVQAFASRLASQRERVLAGGTPTFESSIVLWEVPDESVTARLLPLGPDGAKLIPEASRIDLRSATVESLVATGAVNDDLAVRTIAARDALGGGTVQPDALLAAGSSSLTPEELYGPLEDVMLGLDEDADVQSGAALERLLEGGATVRGLADVLTAFAEEPSLSANGERRIALDGAWDATRRDAVDALLGEGSAGILEPISKAPDGHYAAMFAAWRAKHPEPKEWVNFLDGTAADGNPLALGRLDVLHASSAALRSLPGIDDERAARIVREREALPEEARRSAAWLVERGILTADEFAAIFERVTTRSVLWRIRVAVTFGSSRVTNEATEPTGRSAVLEAVVDLGSKTPRIAFLRDIGGLDTVASLAGDAPERTSDRATGADPIDAAIPPDVPAPPPIAEVTTEKVEDASNVPNALRGAGRWRRTRGAAE